MRINHNIAALNTHRQLNTAAGAQSKSMEKLSSGLRINKAGDDAAGLAISEKMRGQIRGLDMASKNAQDGISFVQTAEGALNETHDILQRMRELAVQSSNDTNTDADRAELQKEVDQLAQEVTRIANNTEFNTKSLLNGAVSNSGESEATFHIGANSDQNLSLSIGAMDASSLGIARDVMKANVSSSTDVVSAQLKTSDLGTAVFDGATATISADDTAQKTQWAAGDTGLTGVTLQSKTDSSKYNDYKITVNSSGTSTIAATFDATSKTITLSGSSTSGDWTATAITTALSNAGFSDLEASGNATALGTLGTGEVASQAGLAADEVKLTITQGSDTEDVIVKDGATSATFTSDEFKGISLKLDGNQDTNTAATITFNEKKASAAQFSSGQKTDDAVAEAGIDISSKTAANNAITTINSAIETVSAERSKLGAYQNRLDHTINNLNTSSENLTAAESRVRDVDYALAA